MDINWFVDASNGDDSAVGSEAAPLRTLDRARELAGSTDVIGLHRGQTHFRSPSSTLGSLITQSVVGYGDSVLPATLSGGQSLLRLGFISQGNGIYRTTISLARAHQPGGSGISGTATTYPFLRLGDEYFEWIVGQPTIADNLNALAVRSGPAFCMNVSGSSTPDLRHDISASTEFDLFVRLQDGGDPSGLPLIAMSHPAVYSWERGLLQDLCLRDAWSKDTAGTDPMSTAIPTLRRVEILGAGTHAWVGPCNVDGYRARGLPRPGMFGFDEGRSAGAGLNLFSILNRPDQVIDVRGLDIEGFGTALYGHSSSQSQTIAKRVDVTETEQEGFALFRVRNCGTAIQFDANNGNTVVPEGISVTCEVDITDVEVAMRTEGPASLDNGGTVIYSSIQKNKHNLSTMRNGNADHTYRGITFFSPNNTVRDFTRDLSIVQGVPSRTPTLTLENCTLPLHPDFAFKIGSGGASEGFFNLRLVGSTVIGDSFDSLRRRYPATFSATNDVAFAFGDLRSKRDVRERLSSNGVANTIAESTTLLRNDGSAAERPG
ncbi:hypothetical protein [Erythrobacter sp. F6033]|uniref:hypothetical protein n=1 Tax=Erythrobacter sp. F6033 TaxID=2926401 RepID=UPI001FF102DB|nr:hypothetical protein [Erythrobacter sp. F6033]MCK0128856.1 hypothetical protein [Erythrobacter sp. F6033]